MDLAAAAALLGIALQDCLSQTAIEKAWKSKLLRNHPDKVFSADATAHTQKINEAKDRLILNLEQATQKAHDHLKWAGVRARVAEEQRQKREAAQQKAAMKQQKKEEAEKKRAQKSADLEKELAALHWTCKAKDRRIEELRSQCLAQDTAMKRLQLDCIANQARFVDLSSAQAALIQQLQADCNAGQVRVVQLSHKCSAQEALIQQMQADGNARIAAQEALIQQMQADCNAMAVHIAMAGEEQALLVKESSLKSQYEASLLEHQTQPTQQKNRLLSKGGKVGFKKAVRKFVRNSIAPADENTVLATQEIKAVFLSMGHVIDNVKVFEQALSHNIFRIHSLAKKRRTNAFRGYSMIKLKDICADDGK